MQNHNNYNLWHHDFLMGVGKTSWLYRAFRVYRTLADFLDKADKDGVHNIRLLLDVRDMQESPKGGYRYRTGELSAFYEYMNRTISLPIRTFNLDVEATESEIAEYYQRKIEHAGMFCVWTMTLRDWRHPKPYEEEIMGL